MGPLYGSEYTRDIFRNDDARLSPTLPIGPLPYLFLRFFWIARCPPVNLVNGLHFLYNLGPQSLGCHQLQPPGVHVSSYPYPIVDPQLSSNGSHWAQ